MPMYDNIYQAMLSIFVILSGDNWDQNMKQTMVLAGPILSALFTIITMVIGIYAVLNLFLAILLSNLNQLTEDDVQSSEAQSESDDIDAFREGISSQLDRAGHRSISVPLMDRVTVSHTSFWLPTNMQKQMLANTLRFNEQEPSMVDKLPINTCPENHDKVNIH